MFFTNTYFQKILKTNISILQKFQSLGKIIVETIVLMINSKFKTRNFIMKPSVRQIKLILKRNSLFKDFYKCRQKIEKWTDKCKRWERIFKKLIEIIKRCSNKINKFINRIKKWNSRYRKIIRRFRKGMRKSSNRMLKLQGLKIRLSN